MLDPRRSGEICVELPPKRDARPLLLEKNAARNTRQTQAPQAPTRGCAWSHGGWAQPATAVNPGAGYGRKGAASRSAAAQRAAGVRRRQHCVSSVAAAGERHTLCFVCVREACGRPGRPRLLCPARRRVVRFRVRLHARRVWVWTTRPTTGCGDDVLRSIDGLARRWVPKE